MIRECGDSEAKMAREQASNFLSNAVKMRVDMEQVENTNISKARDEGSIINGTPDKDLDDYASKLSYQHSCMSMLNQPPTTAAFNLLDKLMIDAQHPKGLTWNESYGNIRKTSASKQRGDNTRLINASALHELDHTNPTKPSKLDHTNPTKPSDDHNKQSPFNPDGMEWALNESIRRLPYVPLMHPTQSHAHGGVYMGYGNRPAVHPPYTGITPPPYASASTPVPASKIAHIDPTLEEICDVCDIAIGENIDSDQDKERGVVVGEVMDGLNRPYDKQMIMGNVLMIKKQANNGKACNRDELSAARLEGLAKMVQNHKKRNK